MAPGTQGLWQAGQTGARALVYCRRGAMLVALSVDDFRQLHARLTSMLDRLGWLQDEFLEMQYERRAGGYLSPIARRLHVLDSGRLADRLDDGIDAGRLTDEERGIILAADLVVTGVRRDD